MGHECREMDVSDARGPLQAAVYCFGSLWWGKERPTRIFSARAALKDIASRIASARGDDRANYPDTGFDFNGARWEPTMQIPPNTVVMLNDNYPDDAKYNGYFRWDGWNGR